MAEKKKTPRRIHEKDDPVKVTPAMISAAFGGLLGKAADAIKGRKSSGDSNKDADEYFRKKKKGY